MKALVYTQPEGLEFRDFADPQAQADEVLIKVDTVGICGSDMHAYLGHDDRRPAPLILGHEAAGTIVGGGQDGARVTINPLVSCGTCAACMAGRENLCPNRQIISMPPREGAFAQFVTMPETNLVPVPDHVSLEKAALAEPLAVSWHSAKLGLAALHPSFDKRVLIIGGGAIGLAAALALKALGCKDVTIVEPNDQRCAYLNAKCDVVAVPQATGDYPLVFDAVGFSATRASASACVCPGGVIVHIGLGDAAEGLDIRRVTLQEITFIGSYTYTAQDFRDCAQALFDGALGDLEWTQIRPLAEGRQAFQDIRSGSVAAPKVLLKPFD